MAEGDVSQRTGHTPETEMADRLDKPAEITPSGKGGQFTAIDLGAEPADTLIRFIGGGGFTHCGR